MDKPTKIVDPNEESSTSTNSNVDNSIINYENSDCCSSSDKMNDWFVESWKFQQFIHKLRGKRRMDYFNISIKEHEKMFDEQLEIILKYIFGRKEDYDKNEKNITILISKVRDFAKEYIKEYCYFNVLYFNLMEKKSKKSLLYCVFNFQKKDGTNIVVDMGGRRYNSWKDFIKNNNLPECYMIYPKYFSYMVENIFVELTFEESIACGGLNKIKSNLDVFAEYATIVATGVLIFNPASASVIVVASTVNAVAGIYNVTNGISKLVDSSKHGKDGITWNEETIRTVGGILTNGAAAIFGLSGIAANMRKGNIFIECAFLNKLAKNINMFRRMQFGFNAVTIILSFVVRYKLTGVLTKYDLLEFIKCIAFIYVATASQSAVEQMMDKLSSLSVKLFEYLIKNPYRAIELVGIPKVYLPSSVNDLIQLIFPNIGDAYVTVMDITVSLIGRTCEIAKRIENAKNSGNLIELMTYLIKELPYFAEEFNEIVSLIKYKFKTFKLKNINNETEQIFKNLSFKNSKELNKNEKISFDEALIMIEPSINKLVDDFYNYKDSFSKESEKKKIFKKVISIINSDIDKNQNIDYISKKIQIYFDEFMNLCEEDLNKKYLNYFKYFCKAKYSKDESGNIKTFMEYTGVEEHNEIIEKIFTAKFEMISSEYLDNILKSKNDENQPDTKKTDLFKFKASFANLSEKDVYQIIKEKIPEILTCSNKRCKLTKTDNKILAIIDLIDIHTTLLFYLPNYNNNGILLRFFDKNKLPLIIEPNQSLEPVDSIQVVESTNDCCISVMTENNGVNEKLSPEPKCNKNTTNTQKQISSKKIARCIVIGDSVIKKISLPFTSNVYDAICYPNIKIRDMQEKIVSLDWNGRDVCIVHLGTHNIHSSLNPGDLYSEIYDLVEKIKQAAPNIKIVISSIIYRRDEYRLLIKAVNSIFEWFCTKHGYVFVNGNNCIRDMDLSINGMYLNRRGNYKLAILFQSMITQ